jgi:hypothetical protein
MDRPKLEVADVFRRYGEAYREQHGASMSTGQRRVMTAIEVCRTAALGGHLERCDDCGHERNAYNSCANRHCPKCQSLARAQWIEDRQAELLDTPICGLSRYVVFNGVRRGRCPLQCSEDHITCSDNRIVVHLNQEIRFCSTNYSTAPKRSHFIPVRPFSNSVLSFCSTVLPAVAHEARFAVRLTNCW